jgi:dipeptidyl aminopeptidase/acylaminoacyl peptidase
MRNALFFAVMVAACGGSKSTPVAPEPAPPAPPPAAPAPPPAPRADAAPTVPAGADAARDAELAKLAAPLFEISSNSGAQLTRDGKRVVFVSDRDGLPQAYVAEIARPAAPPVRLMTTAERITSPTVLPDGKAIVFRSDHGADENWGLYRVNLDGTGLAALTTAKLQRDPPYVVDGAPDQLFYAARATTDVATTVYRTSSKAAGEEQVLYKDPKPGGLADVSRDGKRALYLRYLSQSENHIVVLDLATGTTRPLYPAAGAKVHIDGARFSADGKRALIATDGGGDQALLLSLELASGKELARYVEQHPATASITDLEVARRGNTVAFAVGAGNHDELRVLDATTLKPRATVAVPLGNGGVDGFSEDGKRIAVTWSTPNAPADILALDAATGKLAPLRKDAHPQLEQLGGVEASLADAPAFDGGKIPLNVYLPAGAAGKKLPVIVNYHGGPSGSSAVGWSARTRFFLSLGYAWVEPNVRGSTGFGRAYEMADNGPRRLDSFKDVEAAGRWVAAQPWADPDRLVIFGGSYGGYTVLVGLTRMPSLWRAGVDLVGVASLKTFMATTSGIIHELFLVEFGDPDKDAAFLDSISPLRDAAKIVDPLFVYAGANDPRVPRTESDLIVAAARANRIPVEYMVANNEGHSLAHRETQLAFVSRVARFLETHLK